MSKKSVVARAAVVAVYFFVYFGWVADKVSGPLGFSGMNHYAVNFIFWGPTAIGLWFAMRRARKLSLRDRAGEMYERAKRHKLKPEPPGAQKPPLFQTQTHGTDQGVPPRSEYPSERVPAAAPEAAETPRVSEEEVEDLGETRIVIRQTIYGKATVYLKNFKVEETVQDSIEIKKGY